VSYVRIENTIHRFISPTSMISIRPETLIYPHQYESKSFLYGLMTPRIGGIRVSDHDTNRVGRQLTEMSVVSSLLYSIRWTCQLLLQKPSPSSRYLHVPTNLTTIMPYLQSFSALAFVLVASVFVHASPIAQNEEQDSTAVIDCGGTSRILPYPPPPDTR
jgi:hypothetical protein